MARASAELERGREAYALREWSAAYASLTTVVTTAGLGADDLELLARSAYMLGRDDEYVSGLERAYDAHLVDGVVPRAVRCAFWIGHSMLFRGEIAHARGWFARARRQLDSHGRDCAEQGWLLIPIWLEQMAGGDWEAGRRTASEAAAIGERFGDADLVWLARDEQGRALLKQGRVDDGLRLVDEVLVVAGAGDLSPVVTGIVFCNTIVFCRDAYELGHAREWTDALARWCHGQPEMVAHNGLCLVHRAEMLQLLGAWSDALEQARLAAERFTQGVLNQRACGAAFYRRAEIHRLRGDLDQAEAAYREASLRGLEPQPGLARLRLAQGDHRAAVAAIRRAVGETTDPLERAALLPAYVDIMLRARDVATARSASRQLDEVAERQGSDALAAMSAHARAAVALAEGGADRGLKAARRAVQGWRQIRAPYDEARARVLVGRACRALGDGDSAALEWEAARRVFSRLGAVGDLADIASPAPDSGRRQPYGLTARELEVLRLVAAGKSNREVASALAISERTVARHLQNSFAKLGVASRTAAAAFVYENDLVDVTRHGQQ